MDSSTRSGWSAGAQLNVLMLLSAVFPVLALVGLGAWAVSNIPPTRNQYQRTADGNAAVGHYIWVGAHRVSLHRRLPGYVCEAWSVDRLWSLPIFAGRFRAEIGCTRSSKW